MPYRIINSVCWVICLGSYFIWVHCGVALSLTGTKGHWKYWWLDKNSRTLVSTLTNGSHAAVGGGTPWRSQPSGYWRAMGSGNSSQQAAQTLIKHIWFRHVFLEHFKLCSLEFVLHGNSVPSPETQVSLSTYCCLYQLGEPVSRSNKPLLSLSSPSAFFLPSAHIYHAAGQPFPSRSWLVSMAEERAW